MSSEHKFERMPIADYQIETTHRRIIKGTPLGGKQIILDILDEVESRSMHGQVPLVWSHAYDYNVFDSFGNKWIDFTSTIFVTNIGHSNEHLLSRLKEQIDSGLIASYAYPVEIRAQYMKKLIEFAGRPFEKAFLLSAGTETTEAAIKLMRMYGKKMKKRRGGIIVFTGNWHGRTLGAQQLSSNMAQKDWFYTHDPDVFYLPFPYPWEVGEANASEFFENSLDLLRNSGIDPQIDICGFMLETFQGWGALFYPNSFVKKVREVSMEIQALLCFDEMQAGFARTGKAFGFQHYEVEPDLICCGKGMGGGFPLSGVIGKSEIMDLPSIGNMSSTHSGNPLACAAGLAVIEEIERLNLIEKADTDGILLEKELQNLVDQYPLVLESTHGKGLIRSLIFKDTSTATGSQLASSIVDYAFKNGLLLVHTGRESIKFGPPLTIPSSAIDESIEIIAQGLSRL